MIAAPFNTRKILAWIGLSGLLVACRIDPAMAVDPVIQRPRLAATTQTAAIGTMQTESGVHLDPGTNLALPGWWRVGLSERTEAYIGGDTYRWDLKNDRSGTGDLLIGFRHRVWDERGDYPALAFQSETKLPTAQKEDNFGTEVIDWKFAVIADKTIGQTYLSLFAQAGYLSETDGAATDFEGTLAASLLQPFTDRWDWYAEGVSIKVNEQGVDRGYIGMGFHYRLGGGSLIDLGVIAGFGDAPEDTILVLGYTRNIGAFYRLR